MKPATCLLSLLSILVAWSALSGCRNSEPAFPATAQATQRMDGYLLSNYDSQMRLVRESPNANPNVYWLYSDNYLVSLALRETEPDTVDAIIQAMDGYQLGHAQRWDVLAGEVVSSDLFALGVTSVVMAVREANEVRSEVPAPLVPMDDWQEYADRLLLASVNASNGGDIEEARRLFEMARRTFDGRGFADKAFRELGYYDTYKLALFLIAAERLGVSVPERARIVSSLLSLQENDAASNRHGGVYTEYDRGGRPFPHTDINTETTSLVLLALK